MNNQHRQQKNYYLVILLLAISLLSACMPAVVATTATGVSLVHDRRTAGTVIDDKGIEFKALHALSLENFYDDSHLVTTSYNGYVLLSGQVPNYQAREQAAQVIADLPKVRKIFNELTVGKPSGFSTRTKDSWITASIKTRLVTDQNIDPTRVKVVTEAGNVFLMGLVSRDEALLATEKSQTVRGVKKITRLFEYTEENEQLS